MANYKAVDADQLDADLGKVADAIRAKGGTSAQLSFPAGFASAVANIQTGGTAENLDDVLTEQEELIAELQDVLRSKASGGGGNTEVEDGLISRTGTFEYTNDRVTGVGKHSFYTCTNVTAVSFPKATSVGTYAFYQCSNLASADLPLVTSLAVSAFYQCSILAAADFPLLATCGGSVFYNCYHLKRVDLGKTKTISDRTFYGCGRLTALILRSTTLCSLATTGAFTGCCHILGKADSSYNPNGDHDGYIYVPRALLENYKAATNWSVTTLVTQFRALEDYTVDGTIYGSLDETKI